MENEDKQIRLVPVEGPEKNDKKGDSLKEQIDYESDEASEEEQKLQEDQISMETVKTEQAEVKEDSVTDVYEETTEEPGAAVLTNGSTLSSYMVQAKLNREQTRYKNKDTLLEVINNNDIGDK